MTYVLRRSVGIGIALISLIAGLAAAVPPASAAVPGKNGKILLSVSPSSNSPDADGGLAYTNANGRSITFLSSRVSEYLSGAAFAADGRNVFYHDPFGNPEYVDSYFSIGVDAYEPRLLWSSGTEIGDHPSVAPDGKSMISTVFRGVCVDHGCSTETPDPANGIYERDFKDQTTQRLDLDSLIRPTEAIFSPDGKQIAIVSQDMDKPGFGPHSIYTVNLDTMKFRLVTRSDTPISDINFSPDGRKIAFAHYRFKTSDQGSIEIVQTNDGRLSTITGFGESNHPIFSPDGTKIAFNRQIEVPYTAGFSSEVWTMNPDGTGQEPLITGPGLVSIEDWGRASPFRFIRYVHRRSLVVVRVFGPGMVRISGPRIVGRSRFTKVGGIIRVPAVPRKQPGSPTGSNVKLKVRFAPVGGLPSSVVRNIHIG